MPKFPDIAGTLASFFQLGKGGAGLRSNSGTIEARTAANSAYAPMRCDSLTLTTPLDPSYGGVPIGSVFCSAVSSAPSGYLLCDGSAVSRTTYANLFAAIGTTYGTGNGSTTFNLPNLLGRVPLGAGVSAASGTSRSLGATGGEDSHVISGSELPAHAHGGVVTGSAAGTGYASGIMLNLVSGATATAGSSSPSNILQPFLALNYIIKT